MSVRRTGAAAPGRLALTAINTALAPIRTIATQPTINRQPLRSAQFA